MDAPIEALKQIKFFQEEARRHLENDLTGLALDAAEKALAIESDNIASLELQAEALKRCGEEDKAELVLLKVKALKREAWKKQVEAEIRGHHEVLGEAIRNETL